MSQKDDESVEISFPLRFSVEGTPVSLQASSQSRSRWQSKILEALSEVLPREKWATDVPVSLTIYDFPSEPPQGDVDNIIKPIQDALIPRVYLDDSQVVRVVAQRFLVPDYTEVDSLPPLVADALVNDPPFVYIQVKENPFGDAE